ncbi:hypothetical protein HD597_005176 [Nonomuraea thailandensis]|uniref:Uncharacterized protein n=1 Tax=Nonomuraea thailandensis TaxID=1188745 RepID=A0A9X2GM95_9ACTN|nr:hypothetical protein [Nonomuraea thailandensis]MCP2358156.1 hypothetical protein [Nonomuraea thailandensis]
MRAAAVALGGAVTALAGVWIVARAWATCDVGVSGLANLLALMFYAAPLWALATLTWWVGTGLPGRRVLLARLAVSVLGSLALIWAFMAWQHSPGGDYPVSSCPDNVPPWWPRWLPLRPGRSGAAHTFSNVCHQRGT